MINHLILCHLFCVFANCFADYFLYRLLIVWIECILYGFSACCIFRMENLMLAADRAARELVLG